MITFRINDMRFEYHSPNIVPFPEYVLDAFDLEEIMSIKEELPLMLGHLLVKGES